MSANLQPLRDYARALERELRLGDATEPTHYPVLKKLFEALDSSITATVNPKQLRDTGAPDLAISSGQLRLGHVEAKDVGSNLHEVLRTEQLQRYLRGLPNLILTDFLEFRWFTDGQLRESARLGVAAPDGHVTIAASGSQEVRSLLDHFLHHRAPAPANPKDLALRLASLAQMLRHLIGQTLHQDSNSPLHGQLAAFGTTLLPELDPATLTDDKSRNRAYDRFADMYAQTIAYGLFAACCQAVSPANFSRHGARDLVPRTNPFLRQMFDSIAGAQLPDTVAWLVDDLAALLAQADMAAILQDFGRRTRQDDPVVHFYETFLQAYDPQMREMRGVYYTPEPVVSYIVRSVDHLLRTHFHRSRGLANENTLVLDPAIGTGTFLYTAIKTIHQTLQEQGQLGGWQDYTARYLLPRLFGFELLMAPYAIAHLKLALLLSDLGYQFSSDQRIGVYLTNTLGEQAHVAQFGFAQFLAREASDASRIKREDPIEVVIGNPPWSGHSANASYQEVTVKSRSRTVRRRVPTWIGRLIEDYKQVDGKPLGERNPKWLQDDYVKFIRFAQWRIAQTGQGIVGLVTNHGYLDNPTFRGLRQSLINAFNEIYVLDLHGNKRKKEVPPGGGSDENVFDIQQGVAILLAVKEPDVGASSHRPDASSEPLALSPEPVEGSKSARVHHADLWGARQEKYDTLAQWDVASAPWQSLTPSSPFYLFVPHDTDLLAEYEQGWRITEVMPANVLGFQTHRDHFAIDFDEGHLRTRIAELRNPARSDDELRLTYGLRDNRDWQLLLARERLRKDRDWRTRFVQCLYRPFDRPWCYFSTVAMDYPRAELRQHMLRPNLALLVSRQVSFGEWRHVLVSSQVAESCAVSLTTKEQNYVSPLYLYPLEQESASGLYPPDARHPNLSPAFIAALEERLGLRFAPHPRPAATPSPHAERGLGGEVIERGLGGEVIERGLGGEVIERGPRGEVRWRTPPQLWEKLKPLARQMRRHPTPAENQLWQRLRNRQLRRFKFRRHHPIGRFIVDFYCSEARLVVEIDGPIHDYTREEDALRQEFLEQQGLRVLRFTNEAVTNAPQSVLEAVAAALSEQKHLPTGTPSPLAERGPGGEVLTPEDVFHYAYAIFHSPTYRSRYADFLKRDFPRLPLTTDLALFRDLVALGRELVAFHLMEHPALSQPLPTQFAISGSNQVAPGYPKYTEPQRRVLINKTQYFEGIAPELWGFHIGGYQVLEKWLKDRKGRTLSWDDIQHYQRIVVALRETRRLMAEIDSRIPSWPLPCL